MRSRHIPALAIPVLVLSLLSVEAGGYPPRATVATIPLTRTITIPLGLSKIVSDDTVGVLPVSAGAADELPEGPSGFDVFEDGSFLIADSLSPRISIFDPQGKFLRSWNIGFSADSVSVLPEGAVIVREASSGTVHAFDREGKLLRGSAPRLPELPAALLISPEGGSIAAYGKSGTIPVRLSHAGYSLVSLQTLAVDPATNTYVALEYSKGADADGGIDVDKSVRKYGSDGKLLGETTSLPLNYYIHPVDELRVHGGLVYQLMSSRTKLEINVWDTNPR